MIHVNKIIPLFFLITSGVAAFSQVDTKNSTTNNLLYVQNSISFEDDGLNINSPFELKKIHVDFYDKNGSLVFSSDSIRPRFSREYALNLKTDSSGKISAIKNLHYYVVPWNSSGFPEGSYAWVLSYSAESKVVSEEHEESGKTFLIK